MEKFSPPLVISHISARKIKDRIIVRCKLNPVERKVGCRGFGSFRCQVCKKINNTEEFTMATTKKASKINHSFACNNKYLIYLLSSKHAVSKMYIIPPTNFRSRWNYYKSDVRKA